MKGGAAPASTSWSSSAPNSPTTSDVVTCEPEGASGAVNHFATSDDSLYNGLVVDGFDYNVATATQGLVVIDEEAAGGLGCIVRFLPADG